MRIHATHIHAHTYVVHLDGEANSSNICSVIYQIDPNYLSSKIPEFPDP